MPLILCRATVAKADTGDLKSLHTLFDTYLDHMLGKFEPNRMVQNVHNFEPFGRKTEFLMFIFDQALTPFRRHMFS